MQIKPLKERRMAFSWENKIRGKILLWLVYSNKGKKGNFRMIKIKRWVILKLKKYLMEIR